ncbi:glycosyltransferase family 4 protein [Nonlabens sp. Asnod2-A12]|uniref:glycosyltransferase family 4 protein n=1 Tax=Nonlabens sp. Asnod2-A12 TaxID=3160578 RepID=UPI00386D4F78
MIIFQNLIPTYRVNFFEYLRSKPEDKITIFSGQDSFDQTVVADKNFIVNHELKNSYLFKRKLLIYRGIWYTLFKVEVLIFELNPRNITAWIFLIIRKFFNLKTVLWGHAWSRSGKNSKSEFLRHFMRTLATSIITYTESQAEELKGKMTKKDIKSSSNAIYFKHQMSTDISTDKKNIIYVGRLVVEKKIRFLYLTFKEILPELPDDVNLVIIGSGPEKEFLERDILKEKLHNRVALIEPLFTYDDLKKYYDNSLVSVSPGYVGLNIIQSFSFGVPMVFSRSESHSPEIEAAIENLNSISFETDSIKDFKECLLNIYLNKNYWINRREEILVECKNKYSIERMAQPFLDYLN